MYKTLLGVMKKSCLRAKEKGEKTKNPHWSFIQSWMRRSFHQEVLCTTWNSYTAVSVIPQKLPKAQQQHSSLGGFGRGQSIKNRLIRACMGWGRDGLGLTQGDLSNVYKKLMGKWEECARIFSVVHNDVTGGNMHKSETKLKIVLLLWSWPGTSTGCLERLCSVYPWHTQNPPGYGSGQAGLADPGEDRDGAEVPVSSSCSLVQCLSPTLRETETGMHPYPQHFPEAPLCSVFCSQIPRTQLLVFTWDRGEVYIKASTTLWGLPATGLKCDQTSCEVLSFGLELHTQQDTVTLNPAAGFGQTTKEEVVTFSALSREKWSQVCWQGWSKGKAVLATKHSPTEDLWGVLPGNSTKAETVLPQKLAANLLSRNCSGSCIIALL